MLVYKEHSSKLYIWVQLDYNIYATSGGAFTLFHSSEPHSGWGPGRGMRPCGAPRW